MKHHLSRSSHVQVNETKASIKFQLKKVLCMAVAIGHVGMTEQVRRGKWTNGKLGWASSG